MLRSLRHYLRTQSQEPDTIDRLEKRVWKEEALDDLPSKDERGPSSFRRTLEPFQRQSWGNFWERGWSAYGLLRAHRYHLELNCGLIRFIRLLLFLQLVIRMGRESFVAKVNNKIDTACTLSTAIVRIMRLILFHLFQQLMMRLTLLMQPIVRMRMVM